MATFEYGKNQRVDIFKIQGKDPAQATDSDIARALHNLRTNDEGLVAETVAFLQHPTIRNTLHQWLDDGAHPYVGAVINATRYVPDERFVPSLLKLAAGQDSTLADGALHALAVIGDQRAVPCLIEALGATANDDRRYFAAAGLARLAKDLASETQETIAAHLRQESAWHVRDQLELTLKRLAERRVD